MLLQGPSGWQRIIETFSADRVLEQVEVEMYKVRVTDGLQ